MKRESLLKLTAAVAATLICFAATGASVCFAQDSEGFVEYTVTSSDTLSRIAQRFGVTVDDIARVNGIGNVNFIATGTVLKIPTAGGTETEDNIKVDEPADSIPSIGKLGASVMTANAAGNSASFTTANFKSGGQTTVKTAATSTVQTAEQGASQESGGETASEDGYKSMVSNFDTKVSIKLSNASLIDILNSFAESLGYNIIVKGDSSKTMSLSLKDVTLGDAFDYILKLNDLSYIIKENTIIVGDKSAITSSFIEEAKITEFTLTYVTADTIMGQINTFSIPVTTTRSGGNDYRFLAQGLPEDLARVRNLISMVDRRENAVNVGSKPATAFYAIELTNVTAAEFQRVLSAASLPSGVILSSRPQTLYIFATLEEYNSIKSIKSVVDVLNPSGEDVEKIVEVLLKNVTVDLIESQIRSNADVTIIKISTNNKKVWLRGMSKGIEDAKMIIKLLDTPENAAGDEAQIIEKFTPVSTKYITAATLRETLSRLSIDAVSIVYESNPNTLYVYATDESLERIYDLLKIIDTQDNAGIVAEEVLKLFRPVTCTYLSAQQLNSVLSSMSLPTGLVFGENPKTLYIYATDADFAQILELLKIVDVKENENTELAAGLKSINCRFITAEQLNTMLRNMSLPTGLYYDYNPYVLYLNVTDAQYKEISEVAAYVDTIENSRAGSFDIYYIDLLYINVDKAVEFIKQLGLDLDIIQLASSQKRLWMMGEYTEYLKAKAAATSIDVPAASLTYSFKTFTLENIAAGEAKRLIDNAKLTGVLTYIPYGNENGNKIVIYYPNDAIRDIQNLVNKIDTDEYQATYVKLLEKLDSSLYYTAGEDPVDPGNWTKVIERIGVLSLLSGVPADKFKVYEKLVQDEKDSTIQYVVVYLQYVTLKQYNDVMELKNQLGIPVSDDDDKDDDTSGGSSTTSTGGTERELFYDEEEIMRSLRQSGFGG